MLKRKFQSACETTGLLTNLTPTLNWPKGWNFTNDMMGLTLKLKAGINILCTYFHEFSESDYEISDKE